jgi:hypothetical protein
MVGPVKERLDHVYWIGGGSGGGKSTIARHLASRFGLRVYDTDATMRDHAERSPDAAYLKMFMDMDMDERWVNREPDVMLETFHWYRGEAFEPIVADLAAMAPEPVVAEGFRLLPHLVRPHLAGNRAVWLLPTPQFRRQVFERRGPRWSFLGQVSDPLRALENLLARDGMFTARLRDETARLGLTAISVDGTISEEALTTRVAQAFELQAR